MSLSPTTVTILQLAALAVLGGYLLYKRGASFLEGSRMLERLLPPDHSDWTGTGLDTDRLQPRLRELRRDFLVSSRWQAGRVFIRRARTASARQRISRLSYFADRPDSAAEE